MQRMRVGKGQVSEVFLWEKKSLPYWVREASVLWKLALPSSPLDLVNRYVGSAQKVPIGWMGVGEEQMQWEFLGEGLGKGS